MCQKSLLVHLYWDFNVDKDSKLMLHPDCRTLKLIVVTHGASQQPRFASMAIFRKYRISSF